MAIEEGTGKVRTGLGRFKGGYKGIKEGQWCNYRWNYNVSYMQKCYMQVFLKISTM